MKSYDEVFPFLKKGEMLLSAWVAPPHQIGSNKLNFNTDEQYELIHRLRLNTIYGLYENALDNLDEVIKAIHFARSKDINYFVRDTRVKEAKKIDSLSEITKPYMSVGASGVLIEDEPGIVGFDQLSQSYKLFNSMYNDKLFYVNLMPMHATSSQLTYGAWVFNKETDKIVDYKDYYEAYAKKLNIGYLSYDFYPFEGEYPKIRDDYFKQLSYIYELTKKTDLIPICFIQTCSFNKHVRVPSKTEILWQINTSIAYGTKGIQYFTYFLPEQNEYESFKGALIGHDGKPTNIYNDVKDINQWVKKIESYIINAQVIDIKHEDLKITTTFNTNDEEFKFIMNLSLSNHLKIEQLTGSKYICHHECDVLNPGEAILIFKEENRNEKNI